MKTMFSIWVLFARKAVSSQTTVPVDFSSEPLYGINLINIDKFKIFYHPLR